jgi:hypothetical protein
MAIKSHDPRKSVRGTICSTWWKEGVGDIFYISVTDKKDAPIKVPMFMAEEIKTESIQEMPWLEMDLADCIYEPHDVGAVTRKAEAFIDISLEFANTDNIDATSFGKKVMDELQNQIRTHQMNCTFDVDTTFVSVRNIRHLKETKAHQVVFKYILTLYVLYYDCCE